MIQFLWPSGSLSGYRDCFPDSSLLGDTVSGINRLHCATLQSRACIRRHRHSNYDVVTSPALGRGTCMHCPSTCTVAVLLVNVWNSLPNSVVDVDNVCLLYCGEHGWAEGSESSIVFARVRQYARRHSAMICAKMAQPIDLPW